MPSNPPTRPPWERSRPDLKKPPLLNRRAGPGDGAFADDIWVGDPEEWVAERSPAYVADQERPKPRAIEAGPMEFSTSVGLQPWPVVVWDVNAYYAELGVSWRATRTQIREAYQRLGGDRSDRLTYIVKQLLDPAVRANYDATQPGSVFFDRYIAEYVKAQMLADQVADHGRILTFDDQIAADLNAIDLTKFMNRPFDMVPPEMQNVGTRWRWGYYLWTSDTYDTDRLRQWQELLVSALAGKGVILNLSVGLVGGSLEPMRVEAVGYRVVVFLGDDELPTLQLAQAAADRVVKTVVAMQSEGIPRYAV
jgi:hypothetical protein